MFFCLGSRDGSQVAIDCTRFHYKGRQPKIPIPRVLKDKAQTSCRGADMHPGPARQAMCYGRGILRRDLGCDSDEMLGEIQATPARVFDGFGREVITILIAGIVLARSLPPPEKTLA